jgi:hypothetical protein
MQPSSLYELPIVCTIEEKKVMYSILQKDPKEQTFTGLSM